MVFQEREGETSKSYYISLAYVFSLSSWQNGLSPPVDSPLNITPTNEGLYKMTLSSEGIGVRHRRGFLVSQPVREWEPPASLRHHKHAVSRGLAPRTTPRASPHFTFKRCLLTTWVNTNDSETGRWCSTFIPVLCLLLSVLAGHASRMPQNVFLASHDSLMRVYWVTQHGGYVECGHSLFESQERIRDTPFL